MTAPYDPDSEYPRSESLGTRPEDQQWWASRSTSEPLKPGGESQEAPSDEAGFDRFGIGAPPHWQPYGQEASPQAPTDTTYESWAPSASGWAPTGGLPTSSSFGRYLPNSGLSPRGFLSKSFADLPRPLSDVETGRSAAYLLGLSVGVGILFALLTVLVFAIALAALGGG